MADDDKAPRWTNEPPPGFKPDGTSLIVPASEFKIQPLKIRVGDKLYSEEEYEALQSAQTNKQLDPDEREKLEALSKEIGETMKDLPDHEDEK